MFIFTQSFFMYLTKSGDTWDLISYNLFNNEFKVYELIKANSQYAHVIQFSAGIEIKIPEIETNGQIESLPPWLR